MRCVHLAAVHVHRATADVLTISFAKRGATTIVLTLLLSARAVLQGSSANSMQIQCERVLLFHYTNEDDDI